MIIPLNFIPVALPLFLSPILYSSTEADPTNYLVALESCLFPVSPFGLQDILVAPVTNCYW